MNRLKSEVQLPKGRAGKFAAAVLRGDVGAAARLISLIEDGDPVGEQVLEGVYPFVGRAHRIGITGPPGVGKSTLVGGLSALWREQALSSLPELPCSGGGCRVNMCPDLPLATDQEPGSGDGTPAGGVEHLVGVVAVDPTSPFTGGAILGDRVRMGRSEAGRTDPGLFIRSMASRGVFGGLSPRAGDALDVMDAMGCNPVIVETVGVGQSEVEVASATDTTVLVLSPESGDGVQAMKAGVMEVADIFVINKADREGAQSLANMVEEMLAPLRVEAACAPPGVSQWCPSVHLCEARDGVGLGELSEAIGRHRQFLLSEEGEELALRRREAAASRLRSLVEEELLGKFWSNSFEVRFESTLEELSAQSISMRKAASTLAQEGILYMFLK